MRLQRSNGGWRSCWCSSPRVVCNACASRTSPMPWARGTQHRWRVGGCVSPSGWQRWGCRRHDDAQGRRLRLDYRHVLLVATPTAVQRCHLSACPNRCHPGASCRLAVRANTTQALGPTAMCATNHGVSTHHLACNGILAHLHRVAERLAAAQQAAALRAGQAAAWSGDTLVEALLDHDLRAPAIDGVRHRKHMGHRIAT